MFPTAQAAFGWELIQFEHGSNEEKGFKHFLLILQA